MTFTENEVAVMAAEACKTDVGFKSWTISTKHLQIFAEMVAAEEREACARIAEHLKEYFPTDDVASHLRSRGQTWEK